MTDNIAAFLKFLYNDYMMAKSQMLFAAPLCGAAKQRAVLPYIHCNEHKANDSIDFAIR